MDKPKIFFECYVPVTICNIKCSYCYIIQEGRRTSQKAVFNYSAEHIGKGFSRERLGGTCFINFCGAGETLIPGEITDIIHAVLKQGHYMNITTNGTLTKRFDEITALPKDCLKRLNFAFSLHYVELKKRNLLDVFFSNIKKVRDSGCSFLLQMNICDEYMPYIDEIKQLCMKEVGAYPQTVPTRNEKGETITLMTKKSYDEYCKVGRAFNSPLFEFGMRNFMRKQNKFCYAGQWSYILNLGTGMIKACYNSEEYYNFYENISEQIPSRPVGYGCTSSYCVNSIHFLSFGNIPSLTTPSYAEIRDRTTKDGNQWIKPEMKRFLEGRLYEGNKQYTLLQRFNIKFDLKNRIWRNLSNITPDYMKKLYHKVLE